MNHKLNVRTFAPNEWHIYKDLRLRALADSPDAFSRTLVEEQVRSDDVWIKRIEQGATSGWDLPLLAEVDGTPAGLAWGRIESDYPSVANLYQVWVAPNYRHLGIGKMLLDAIIAWAKAKNAKYLELGVTSADSPAMRLYIHASFKPTGKIEPLRPGSELLCQQMRLDLTNITD
jgi:ribosomal protein S18 acetylase RimI-like enzyme